LAGAEAESEGQSAEIASEGLALTVEQGHVAQGGIPRLWQSRSSVFTMLDIVKAARVNATAAGLKSLACAFLRES